MPPNLWLFTQCLSGFRLFFRRQAVQCAAPFGHRQISALFPVPVGQNVAADDPAAEGMAVDDEAVGVAVDEDFRLRVLL